MGGVGNQFGLNTHENGVAWGTNAVNQLSHGVASGQGATVTRGNLTREQYQEGVHQYQSLLDEKNQLTAQKAQLEGNKELKAGEIDALNNRINELNNKITEHGNTLGRINSLNQQKQTMVDFVNNINSQITAKEGEYNLSDKTRIYEFEDFYKALNKLDWTQYANGAGADNLANQLKARVSEFNPNIANKYGQDKYKEIINAYVNLNSINKQPTVDWFNERLTTKDMGLGYNFNKNNELSINESDYRVLDFKYKTTNSNNNNYNNTVNDRGFRNRNDDSYNVTYGYSSNEHRRDEGNSYDDERAKNTSKVWRYQDKSISDQYLDELEWMYNGLDNTPNYSLYITRNTLRAALNKGAPNLKLKNVEQNDLYGVDYLTTLYANFGDINLVESLQKVINFTNQEYIDEIKDVFNKVIKLDSINNDNITQTNELANNFIRDYEGVDLNATAKNVTSIEETRNLFKPFYDKMIQLRDITNLYKEINSGTLDESTKRQKQAVYLQKLADYRNALNAEIDHYDTLEGYISHFVRPHVRYSDEFVNHFKTATREYIDFLKANRHKLLSYDPNDEFIKEISDKAKSLIQDLKNLNDQKSAKEKEIEGISNQIKNLTDNLGADEQALNQQKQEKQAELEKVQKEKEQLDAQVAEKEKELARKQAEVLEKLKQQSGEGNAVAIGDNSFASGVSAVALGVGSESIGDHALALGTQAKATKSDSIAIGHGTEVTGEQSIAIGKGHRVSGNRSTTIGDPNTITGDDSVAVGNNNTINSNHVMVLGNNITVGENLHHSVVLGSNSTVLAPVATVSHTIAGTQYNFAGTAPVATVSIGAEGKERTLTNLAAGRISNASTDGINGSQLNAVIETLNSLNTELTTLKNAPKTKAPVIKAGDGLSLTEGDDGSITLSNALTFNAGNGIAVNKTGNNVTITNSKPFEDADKEKLNTASTNANSALEKANTNEGAINTANGKITANEGKITANEGKINDLTPRVTANEGKITDLTGKVTTVTNTANEALGKANTAVQPDKLKAGNGISVSKGENGEITITNTHPLSDENKTKYDNASAKAETALQPESLVAGNGVTVNNAGGKVTITNTGVIEIQAGDGVGVQNNNGVVTVSNTKPDLSFEGKDGITVDKQGNNVVISATGLAPKGAGVNNVEGANGISVTKEGDKFIITNTKPFEDTDKETLNTASGKANTAVQPDKLKAGNGISIDKTENGDITVTNTKPFEDADKEKLNNASTTATSALEKANTNEGAINTANGKITANEGKIATQEGKINDLTSRVTANEGNITTLTGNVATVTNTANEALGKANTNAETINNVSGVANEALGKANTAVQPDKLKAGSGISVSKADNGDITIENTKAFEDEDKEKLNTAFDKSNTAVQPNDLTAGKGITINKGQNGINISTNITGGKGISVVESNNGLTINNLMEIKAGKGVKIDNDGNTYTISSTGSALPRFEIRGDDKVVHEVVGALNVAGDENIETTTEGGKVTVKLKKDIDVNSVKSGDNTFGKGGLKVGNTIITAKGSYMGNQVVDGVADGKIAPNSKQAINGGQLAPVVERILDHERAITQLDGKIGYLDQRITRMDKKHNAGIAGVAAMVGIPQVMEAGGVVFGAGVGNHAGANAVAVGASMASDNGRHMIKTSFSVNSQKQVTSSIGYGFKWR